jgi:hypothetical protein
LFLRSPRPETEAAALRREHHRDWLLRARGPNGNCRGGVRADPDDRAIIASKAGAFLRRGPGGWWRLLKNAVRFSLRLGEKPLPPRKWEALACAAGFHDVCVSRILSDACVLTATKPQAGHYRRLTGTAP